MMRNVCLFFLLTLIAATTGCHREIEAGATPETAPIVTFDQFRDAAKDHVSFWTAGSKDGFHYFLLRQGYYRVAASEVEHHLLQLFVDRGGQAEPGKIFFNSRLHSEMNMIIKSDVEPDFMPPKR